MKKINALIFILFFLSLFACSKSQLEEMLELAGENREELQKVLNHFSQNSADSLKYRAAIFLIENMGGHYSTYSPTTDIYKDAIYNTPKPISIRIIDKLWEEACEKKQDIQQKRNDIEVLNASFLIDNINKAFEAWEKAPWKEQVNYKTFCNYILPYRFNNEILVEYWRDSLREEYAYLLEDITDMNEAYHTLARFVTKKMRSINPKCPYSLDVLAINNLSQGKCPDFCLLLGCLMRSFGIPAAYDYVLSWANYSQLAHSWVCMVGSDGLAYTVWLEDSVARAYNPVNSSLFKRSHIPEAEYPHVVDSIKKVAKVYRAEYSWQESMENIFRREKNALKNPFMKDVSEFYNLNSSLNITLTEKYKNVYLCTFLTGIGWEPIACNNTNKKKINFKNLGSEIVYLPATYIEDEFTPLSNPILLKEDGTTIYLNPNTDKTQTVELTRKYILMTNMVNSWGNMIGGKFEAANDKNFTSPVLLHTIEKTPVFHNYVKFEEEIPYRYIRYVSAPECRTSIAELEFYEGDTLLKGDAYGGKIGEGHARRAFDRKFGTVAKSDEFNFWIALDLGEKRNISALAYYPKHDGNSIHLNELYELFYYDMGWKSLGKQNSTSYALIYNDVPENALFWLRNLTRGKEERIFTYENDKQRWW